MENKIDVFLRTENDNFLVGYYTDEKEWKEFQKFTSRDSAIEFAKTLNVFDEHDLIIGSETCG